MHSTGLFPSDRSKSFIHFIGKAGGNGVRPISLIRCTRKLFETLVKNKLQWWVEFHRHLLENQAGFRKGCSTADNLIGLTVHVEEAFSRGAGLLAVFLDVKSAFDNVNSQILLNRLADIGVSPTILRYVRFCTYERQIHCDLLGKE